MYIWQFNINGDILITGRTWQQYKDLLEYLNTCMHDISDNTISGISPQFEL